MPTPNKGESKKDFIDRCIPILIDEGKEQDQAVAQCNGIWDQSRKDKARAMDLASFSSTLLSHTWAVLPSKLEEIIDASRLADPILKQEVFSSFFDLQDDEFRNFEVKDGIATLNLHGILTKEVDLFMMIFGGGGTSSRMLIEDFKAARDDKAVKGIFLDIDSPGGDLDATVELADLIFESRGIKPILAYTELMASAALWIGSGADHVVAANSATRIGSIGVVMVHSEISKAAEMHGEKFTVFSAGKFKAIGNEHEPLSKADKDYIQSIVDYNNSLFVEAIARNYDVSTSIVNQQMGDGKLFIGQQALDAGLANEIANREQAMDLLKSVISGIILSGVWPIWIQPKVDHNLNVILNSSSEQIEEAIKQFPEAKAVFVTTPTYNGICTDIEKISEITHHYGKTLLVDEAWGAHLKFHPELPKSGVEVGADLVLQSFHKVLSTLSQGSVLHYNSKTISFDRVKKVVSLLQTTSPSYPILASIDIARRQIVESGRKIIDKLISWSNWAREEISKLESISSFYEKDLESPYKLDPTKITINLTRLGLTGQEVDDILNREYNIQVDCSDIFGLIAILGVGTRKKDLKNLVDSLRKIDVKYKQRMIAWKLQIPSLSTEMVIIPREVVLRKDIKEVSLKKSIGSICAETLTPYPPGIPILIPGERVTSEIVEYISGLDSSGIRIVGERNEPLNKIKVVEI